MKPKFYRQGFTLVELLVAIAIILVLAVVSTFSMQSISDSAKATKHISNMRQLWSTVLLFTADNQGVLPPNKAYGSGTWQHHLVRWNEDLSVTDTSQLFQNPTKVKADGFLQIFNSPLNKTKGNMAFGSGGWPNATSTTEVFGRPLASIDDPSKSIALMPYYSDIKTLIGGNWQRPSSINDISFDSQKKVSCGFVDGSVSTISRDSLEKNRYIFIYPSRSQPN